MITKHRLTIALISLCLSLSGCATIGAAGSGLINGFVGAIKLTLKALHKIADILSVLPSF